MSNSVSRILRATMFFMICIVKSDMYSVELWRILAGAGTGSGVR